jgi:hypothetical protein
MAHFLRDEILTNLTIDEEALTQISHVFAARAATMPEELNPPPRHEPPNFFLTYIIRFDNKGHRVFSLEDLLNYFRQANYVERILFTLESRIAVQTNRNIGSFIELRFDEKEPNTCILAVSSDAGDWADASFAAIKEVLNKRKNWNRWARSAWTQLLIQISGVFVGFLVSLWAASKIAPSLSIENPFLISFFLVLLIFSNLWVYINQRLHVLVNLVFPNLKFYRPHRDKMHWLLQAIIGGIVVAIMLYIINQMFAYIGKILGSFIS